MSDAAVRKSVSGLDAYVFDPAPFTTPKPLRDARVAIVTTAGFRFDVGSVWALGDASFTVLPDERRDFRIAHASTNFDRSGVIADLNVVFPVDRLHELAAQGVIGSVAPRHLSFMGAQPDHTATTLRLDTGPAAAQLLLEDGVDVVLLTPV